MTLDLDDVWSDNPDQTELIAAYQRLIDSGQAWRGRHVMRVAMALIIDGMCVLGEEGHLDECGIYVPSRHEVVPGTKGSPEYAERLSGWGAHNPRNTH